MWHRLLAFLYPTRHRVLLPCQLVWQETEVGKLETARNFPDLPVFTFARRLKRRAKVKTVGLGGLRYLACEPSSPTRRARGGQKRLEACATFGVSR